MFTPADLRAVNIPDSVFSPEALAIIWNRKIKLQKHVDALKRTIVDELQKLKPTDERSEAQCSSSTSAASSDEVPSFSEAEMETAIAALPQDGPSHVDFQAHVRALHASNPMLAKAFLNAAAHVHNYFLDIQALEARLTPKVQQPSAAVSANVSPRIPVVTRYPDSYTSMWRNQDDRSDLARARRILGDYTKGGFFGRLMTCHLGRHHTDAVERALGYSGLCSVSLLLSAVRNELGTVTLNPNGSLARRLRFLEEKAGIVASDSLSMSASS